MSSSISYVCICIEDVEIDKDSVKYIFESPAGAEVVDMKLLKMTPPYITVCYPSRFKAWVLTDCSHSMQELISIHDRETIMMKKSIILNIDDDLVKRWLKGGILNY